MMQESSLYRPYLRTSFRRRTVVVLLYLMVLLLTAVTIYRHRYFPMALLIQTLALGSLFGGIRRGGPVKPYGKLALPILAPDPHTGDAERYSLTGTRAPFESMLLDERETGQRDLAHYRAFVILRWVLGLSAVAFWFGSLAAPAVVLPGSPVLLWALMVFVLSLPQSVILWTEPDPVPEVEFALQEAR
jgi:hypothetical protein